VLCPLFGNGCDAGVLSTLDMHRVITAKSRKIHGAAGCFETGFEFVSGFEEG
jgi:hypothetical protein